MNFPAIPFHARHVSNSVHFMFGIAIQVRDQDELALLSASYSRLSVKFNNAELKVD